MKYLCNAWPVITYSYTLYAGNAWLWGGVDGFRIGTLKSLGVPDMQALGTLTL